MLNPVIVKKMVSSTKEKYSSVFSQDCMVNEGALSIASSINLLSTHVLVCKYQKVDKAFFRSCITGEKFDAADAFTNYALLL